MSNDKFNVGDKVLYSSEVFGTHTGYIKSKYKPDYSDEYFYNVAILDIGLLDAFECQLTKLNN